MEGMQCDPAVVNLPLSDPQCVKAVECCIAFYAAENASQGATPFADQFLYGHYTTYYWVATLGLLAICHVATLLLSTTTAKPAAAASPHSPDSSTATSESQTSVSEKAKAATRFMSYRSLLRSQRYTPITIPRLGLLAFFVLTLVFLAALTFAERPYYRPQFGFGSPPIAIRCGLMAFACIPILVALGGKANLVTLLTGISYEKLNIAHQWVAWMSFVLSLIHTIPFFIASVRDPGNGGYARVVKEFYYWGTSLGASEYSGVPPLAMLFGLCVFSIPQIRKRFYECFYYTHILMSIAYLGTLFWHAGHILDSWAYLWATLAIWLTQWLVRMFWFMRGTHIRSGWFRPSQARIRLLPAGLMRIEVERPADFATKPGQHAFLRFTTVSALDSHPFTIAAAPPAASSIADASSWEHSKRPDSLLFLAKVRDGFTRKLAAHASAHGGEDYVNVLLDGPYGGLSRPHIERRYDSMLLVTGGSGISFSMGWLQHVASLPPTTTTTTSKLRTVTLVWAVRNPASFGWVLHELLSLPTSNMKIRLRLFVTGGAAAHEDGSSGEVDAEMGVPADGDRTKSNAVSGAEKDALPLMEQLQSIAEVSQGRPDLRTVINDATEPGKRLVVFGCGPYEMNHDLSNTCASAQKNVLSGRTKEVALHLEAFDW